MDHLLDSYASDDEEKIVKTDSISANLPSFSTPLTQSLIVPGFVLAKKSEVNPPQPTEEMVLFGAVKDRWKSHKAYEKKGNHDLGRILPPEPLAKTEHDLKWSEHLSHENHESLRKRRLIEASMSIPELTSERVRLSDPSSETFLGPWAPYKGEDLRAKRFNELMKEAAAAAAETTTSGGNTTTTGGGGGNTTSGSTFTFHSTSRDWNDYQGRSWVESCSSDLKPPPPSHTTSLTSFPRSVVHTYEGHTSAVLRQAFIPSPFEELLLTCSMDSTIKIWDVHKSRECIATYSGHTRGVKDIGFSSDGRNFYSCGMDFKILQWDVETGKVVTDLGGNGKLPLSLNVHPKNSSIILCGHQNKEACQYDSRIGNSGGGSGGGGGGGDGGGGGGGKIVQRYTEHLAAVNTATFCDSGRKLITTSDDKRMFVWEYGINVVMKHIAEPYMSSIPATTLDHRGEYLICQSMDNQIVLYEAQNRFRLQTRRRFKGHHSSGYAIKPSLSHNSQFLASGDINGSLWIWDYQNTKVIRSSQISGHQGPIMSVLWNKYKSNLLTTTGWDGTVKLWE